MEQSPSPDTNIPPASDEANIVPKEDRLELTDREERRRELLTNQFSNAQAFAAATGRELDPVIRAARRVLRSQPAQRPSTLSKVPDADTGMGDPFYVGDDTRQPTKEEQDLISAYSQEEYQRKIERLTLALTNEGVDPDKARIQAIARVKAQKDIRDRERHR